MDELVLDLHLHSRYSRAVSQKMNLENMYIWGRKKGLNMLSVTDFTHPLWFEESQRMLIEVEEGVYALRDEKRIREENPAVFKEDFLGPYFILSTEISAIYTENERGHRIHNLVFAPNFKAAEKINKELQMRGFNLSSDGRPTLGSFSTKDLMELLMEIDERIALIPCHVWTPWFSLYGSRSGYDHIQDCFGKYSGRIFAVESGLSSDPAMNWRIDELTTRSIVSFSDAHSLTKMGREATVLRRKTRVSPDKSSISDNPITIQEITYSNILNAFVRGKEKTFEIAYTIEFYPQEGKYHFTGHRNCNVSYSPLDDRQKGTVCPVCHRELTVGVMHRVDALATFPDNRMVYEKDTNGVVWVKDSHNKRPPFVSLVPLLEVLSESLSSGVSSQKVMRVYDILIQNCFSEHEILLRTQLPRIRAIAGERIAEAIEKVRARTIAITPGFDGEYGKVAIWDNNSSRNKTESGTPQMGFGF